MRTSGYILGAALIVCAGARCGDNELAPQERAAGWRLLFDGKTHQGWMTSGGKPSKVPVEDGAIQPHGCGDYMMVYEKPLENFVLALDFKITPKCNSGIFVRTSSLTPLPGKDVGYNGLEIAIDDTQTAGYTDTGAIYDLSKPSKNAMKPVGEWNHIIITVNASLITVELNGVRVNEVDLSKFMEKSRRPDGSQHKFDVVYRDHPTKGYIGLQDHGSKCFYKNIKLKVLPGTLAPGTEEATK